MSKKKVKPAKVVKKRISKTAMAWSDEEEKLLKELRPNCQLGEILKEFRTQGYNRSKKAIERKCSNLGLSYEPPEVLKEEENSKTKKILENAWEEIAKIKEKYKEEQIITRPRGIVNAGTKLRKILCLSDLHIPFERDDLIMEIIEEHKDADILVVNGDMMDLHAVSTFPKERSVPLRLEYNLAMKYMKIFSETFPEVFVIRGNHEFRLNSYFYKNISPSVTFMISKEILGHICNGIIYDDDGNEKERLDFSNVNYFPGQESWFFKIGKTIFLHPFSFSKVDGKTTVLAWEYFADRDDIDSVVTAHTHQIACIIKKGRLCLEQGCLCVPLDYSKQGKLSFGPQCLGYSVIYQDEDGNTDFNLSKSIFLGIQYPIKKSYEDL